MFIYSLFLLLACNAGSKSHSADEYTLSNAGDTTITFGNSADGIFPAGWSEETSSWLIVEDDNNAALKMERNDGSQFNIAVVRGLNYRNVEIEVRIKPLSGNEDQGGGLVWRYIDKNNYYIMRANPLENNIRFYKVINGKRKQLESASTTMTRGQWFTIKVIALDDNIECHFNGVKMFQTSESTFSNPGLIGFWSKADAVSLFDDLKITNLN